MRSIGTLASTDSSVSRPAFFVIVHDASNMGPSAVLCENILQEEIGGIVWYNDIPFNVDPIITNLKVRETRPQNIGSGLIRRDASFSLLSNNSIAPYINGVISKNIWSGGKSLDTIAFSIWGIDIASIIDSDTKDITNGVCFGFYKIDTLGAWDEESRACSINLLDITLTDDRIVAANVNSGVKQLLSFNSGYNGKVMPTVYGYVPRVKMLRGYPDFQYSDGDGSNVVFSGVVGENYNSLSTAIVLEKPSYESSVLRQMIASGNTAIRIRMDDDEVMQGTLIYDVPNNQVVLFPVARSAPYYGGKAYSNLPVITTTTVYGGNNRPADYDTYYPFYRTKNAYGFNQTELQIRDSVTTPYGGILFDKLQTGKSGFGYIKLHASFPGSDVTDQTVYAKLSDASQAITKDGKRTNLTRLFIETDTNKGAYSTPTRYSSEPVGNEAAHNSQVAIGAFKIYGITEPVVDSVPYIKFKTGVSPSFVTWYTTMRNASESNKVEPHDNIELYFRNPVLGNGSGTAGVTKWTILAMSGAVSYSHYLNNGYTYVDASTKVYGEGEDGLVEIPSGFILSKLSGVAEYGFSNLIKITLSVPPTAMGIGLISNNIYIDCAYQPGFGWDRKRIIYELLSTSSLVQFTSQSNLNPNSYSGSPETDINLGFVCTGETYTDMLDKILFDCSEVLSWNNQGGFHLLPTANPNCVDGSGLWVGTIVDSNDLYDNTSAIILNKFKSRNIDAEREYIPYYLQHTYGGWMDPYYVSIESKDPIAADEIYLEHHFSTIQTKEAAAICSTKFRTIGSASGIYTSGRSIRVTGGIQQLAKFEPLDAILVNNYPGITDDTSLSSIMTRVGSSIRYAPHASNYIMQGVCIVDSIEYSLSIGDISVEISAKICQKYMDVRGIVLNDPPTKLGTTKNNTSTSLDDSPISTQETSDGGGTGSAFPWDVTVGSIRSQGTVISGYGLIRLSHSCGSQVRMQIDGSGTASILVTNCSGVGQKITPTGIVPITVSGDDPEVETGDTLAPIQIEACVDGVTKTITLYGSMPS